MQNIDKICALWNSDLDKFEFDSDKMTDIGTLKRPLIGTDNFCVSAVYLVMQVKVYYEYVINCISFYLSRISSVQN